MPTNSSLSDGIHASREGILEDVKQIVSEHSDVPPDEMRPDGRLIEDLGCDSLDIIEIIMELEEQFDISVPDELGDQIATVGDVADGVVELLEQSA